MTFEDVADDTRFQNVPGLLGPAVDITVPGQFQDAVISMQYDPASVPGGDIAGLRIAYFDEVAQTFLPLSDVAVDAESGRISSHTTHFSTYVLFYIPAWNAVWTDQDGGPRGGDGQDKNLDVMLVIDSSGSMTSNDPARLRIAAGTEFIDALIDGDQVGVVDFNTNAFMRQGLTTQTADAKTALSGIGAGGGTNIGAGVRKALDELDRNAADDHLRAIIMLTDGVGTYDDALTERATSSNVVIYTIGLGTGVNPTLLQSIATRTGGQYFAVNSADGLPQVFRRIADGGTDLTDSDGDGLPDAQERAGIRICTGELLKTDPTTVDTDGDGISDLDELGDKHSRPAGTCYGPVSNPNSDDTDGDGLTDVEETELGTKPTRYDTDRDGLSDGEEVDSLGSDPTDADPDFDGYNDLQEKTKDSDPFSRTLTGGDHASAVLLGFVMGDGGTLLKDAGLLDAEFVDSLSYLCGWMLSGFFVLGDVRDLATSLIDLRLGDALLSTVALIPLAGDTARVVRTVQKYVTQAPTMRRSLGRWIIKQFPAGGTARATAPAAGVRAAASPAASLRNRLLQVLGAGSQTLALPQSTLEGLARSRNDLRLIERALQAGVQLRRTTPSAADEALIRAAVAQHWGTNLSRARRAEAIAVESAVNHLSRQGYTPLYVGRPGHVPGTTTHVSQGPDIIARGPNAETVIIEAKGSHTNPFRLSRSRLRSTVGGNAMSQPEALWVRTNAGTRYLNALNTSSDPLIQEAVQRVDAISYGANYHAITIGAGNGATHGRVDQYIGEVMPTAAGRAPTGVSSMQIITIDIAP
ncbi:MAG: VWA domain-containing protein [Actinomycetales bacterium]